MTTLQQVLDAHTTHNVDAIGRTATTSAAVAMVSQDGVLQDAAFSGSRRLLPEPAPLTMETPFDLASITKVFTATLTAMAVELGHVDWDTPMVELTDGWANDATLIDVVEHVSGLPAWEKFYEDFPLNPSDEQAQHAREAIRERILARELASAGTVHRYSDLGYILLGFLVEEWLDDSLDNLLVDKIAKPLGLESLVYGPGRPGLVEQAASTEWCSRRGRWVTGTVHDENCDVLGGVAGHAGIFGTARDVLGFGEAMLTIANGEDGIITSQTLRRMWAGRETSRGHRGGWDTPTGDQSSVGRGFPRDTTFGHLGFTGTSLWVESSRGIAAVLLTNRVHPSRENPRIKRMRIDVHEAIWTP